MLEKESDDFLIGIVLTVWGLCWYNFSLVFFRCLCFLSHGRGRIDFHCPSKCLSHKSTWYEGMQAATPRESIDYTFQLQVSHASLPVLAFLSQFHKRKGALAFRWQVMQTIFGQILLNTQFPNFWCQKQQGKSVLFSQGNDEMK